jgi:DNA-binding response OmpR family regulator
MMSTQQSVIAVIDDDADLQNLMEQVLGDCGYRVIGFPVGEGADEVVQAAGANLVILDIRLPGVSGFHVLNRLLTNPATTHIPVLVCTGTPWTPAERASLTAMGVRVLPKPFDLDDLVAEVAALLAPDAEPLLPGHAAAPAQS